MALIAAALWIWTWRVRRVGLLLLGWAFCVLAGDLMNVYPDSRLVATAGLLLFIQTGSFLFHVGFSYPTGRLERHWPTRLWVFGWLYAAGVIIAIPPLLFQGGQAPSYFYLGHGVSWLDEWNRWWIGWLWLVSLPLRFG